MQRIQRENIAKDLLTKVHSCKQIAERCNVSLKTVYNVRTKLKNGDSMKHKKGGGRKQKLHRNERIRLVFRMKKQPRTSLRTLKSQLKLERGLDVSHETIRRTAKKLGYSKKVAIRGSGITPANEIKRVAWAKKHMNIHWKNMFFSDECSIWLQSGRIMLWTKGKRPVMNIPRHTPKLHIWGAISSRGTTPIKVFKNNFNSIHYCNVLNEVLLETANALYPDGWKLQEDNSSVHKSKLSESYKKSVMIRTIDWPANSPDLNHIENLWAILKKQIQNKAPKDIKELEKLIETEWQTFDQEFLANFINSMKRCQMVIASDGKKINY